MAEIRAVLRRPIITEKSTWLREGNQYVIEVDPTATKGQIREAVQQRSFKVDVVKVRTVRVLGKVSAVGKPAPSAAISLNREKRPIVDLKLVSQQIKWEEVA